MRFGDGGLPQSEGWRVQPIEKFQGFTYFDMPCALRKTHMRIHDPAVLHVVCSEKIRIFYCQILGEDFG